MKDGYIEGIMIFFMNYLRVTTNLHRHGALNRA